MTHKPDDDYSGEFRLRLAPYWHKRLAECAQQQRLSMNSLATVLIATGIDLIEYSPVEIMARCNLYDPLSNTDPTKQEIAKYVKRFDPRIKNMTAREFLRMQIETEADCRKP